MRSTISSTLPTSGDFLFTGRRGAKANIRGQPDAKTAVKPPSTASITFPGSHSFCHQPALRFVTKGRFALEAANDTRPRLRWADFSSGPVDLDR
jgi:hypothetical protein